MDVILAYYIAFIVTIGVVFVIDTAYGVARMNDKLEEKKRPKGRPKKDGRSTTNANRRR